MSAKFQKDLLKTEGVAHRRHPLYVYIIKAKYD